MTAVADSYSCLATRPHLPAAAAAARETLVDQVFDAMQNCDVRQFRRLDGTALLHSGDFGQRVFEKARSCGAMDVLEPLLALHNVRPRPHHFVDAVLAGQFGVADLLLRAGLQLDDDDWLLAMTRFAAQHHSTLHAVLSVFQLPTTVINVERLLDALDCTIARRAVHQLAQVVQMNTAVFYTTVADVHFVERRCMCGRATNPATVPDFVQCATAPLPPRRPPSPKPINSAD